MKKIAFFSLVFTIMISCGGKKSDTTNNTDSKSEKSDIEKKLGKYTPVKLEYDIKSLSENNQKMIPILIEIAQIMDDLFWDQALSTPKKEFLDGIKDENLRKYAMYNYGPWDRLEDNVSFIDGYKEKPKGANFYPTDMDTTEFMNWDEPNKKNQYSVVRRNNSGKLQLFAYSEYYKDQLTKASTLLKQAAALAEDEGLKKYLELRAEAFLTNNYQPSDFAWMAMKTNVIDFVVGPIENYEDQLYGYRSSFEAYILIKDMEWSKKLEKFAAYLPELQLNLPCDAKYKKEKPGSDSELNAYDVIYYAGDCNSASKTIAINLPNDEEVQLKKGTRRLQLKNVMKAKFEKILVPISKELIVEEQQGMINFDAFFNTVMFHEVAHGLGIKNTINNKGLVREALKEHASALEEGKADILGLYMITELHKKGEIDGKLEDHYVTFLAGIFRSVRFGAASAHGKANMIRFNYFQEKGAFERTANGKYKVNFEKMTEAMTSLSTLILQLQGDGDYDGVDKLVKEKGVIKEQLQKDLDMLSAKNIPVDIVFEQGKEVLGIK